LIGDTIMFIEEIAAKLEEINQDVALPMKSENEVDVAYIDKTWPGLISGITNFMLDTDGKRQYDNIKAIKAAGFHCFSMDRSAKAGVAAGRVRTDKGMILVY
jgi:hypothetical protein